MTFASPSFGALTFVLLLCAALWLACTPAAAQQGRAPSGPRDGAPPAAEMDAAAAAIVAKVDALRGAADLPATLSIAGDYEVFFEGAPDDRPVAAAGFREHFAGPLARHTSDMGPMGQLERGLTADLVWELDPALGAKRYDGPAGRTVRRYFAALRGQSPKALFARIGVQGTEQVDGAECTVLAMQPADGGVETWTVDPATGRVLRIEMALPSPDSAGAVFDMAETMQARVTFGDWRAIDGRSFPFRRVVEMGPARVVMQCAEVTAGAPIPAERFAPPAAVTQLPARVAGQPIDGDEPTYLVVERQAQPVASIRVKCRPDAISATLAVLLPEVMAHISATGGKIAGAPFSRYHSFDAGEIDLEAGIPVSAPVEAKGRVENRELPAGKTLTAWHVGPYDKLSVAHEALRAHVEAEGIEVRGAVWEIYWTDPGMVPDPSKWRTQLFLPIR